MAALHAWLAKTGRAYVTPQMQNRELHPHLLWRTVMSYGGGDAVRHCPRS